METSGKSILPQKTDDFNCDQEIPSAQNRKESKNDRRFSGEQIRSLESSFKQETKLDSRKKLELARDLGLQPRQIAIWFQNRRARWKSKQIEQEYRVLKANYDNLNLQFDDLKREKQSLQIQLQELIDAIKNLDKDNLKDDRDSEVKESIPNSLNKGMEYDHQNYDHNLCADEDDGDVEKLIKYFGKIVEKDDEEEEVVSWGEEEEDGEMKCLASSAQRWPNLSLGHVLFDPSSGTSNWWESD